MTQKKQLILIYSILPLVIALSVFNWYWHSQKQPVVKDVGRQKEQVWRKIEGDLVGVHQLGESVQLSSLADKTWILCEFYAKCPMCAQRNAAELIDIYKKYQDDPRFHLVCISIDPDDDVEKLQEYAEALNADVKNWWFLKAPMEATHDYLEKQIGFYTVKERVNPEEIATKGRYSHDLSIVVVQPGMKMVTKRDLITGKAQGEALYETWKAELTDLIEAGLSQP